MDTNGRAIGQTLRRERERKRVSLETISRATLVRREYLELIDADQLELLPPGAYAKGFIRAYAAHLGVDHRPLVQAYEHAVLQPAPELSSVVQQPIRVPHAAQPRTWRIAAGAAAGVLLLLGLLGVVRSGDQPAKPPDVELAALGERFDAGAEAATPNPLGAVVRVEAMDGQTWVRAVADGRTELFDGLLTKGSTRRFQGVRDVYLIIGNPRVVRIRANGHEVGTPAEKVYHGTFTPETNTLPPSQPQ